MEDLANNKKIDTGERLGAMILDHGSMSFISMAFSIPWAVSFFANVFKSSEDGPNLNFMAGPWGYLTMLGFALYFCKDCINGRSIAKRLLKLQVVDNATGQVATPLQCFVRDIFIVIWPIEGIVALINTSRRLGDRVAGTKLVVFDPNLNQPKINIIKILIPVALAYGCMFLILIPFNKLNRVFEVHKINYLKNSFNQQSSTELEQLLGDSLGNYFTPSVKVYDSIQRENVKFISIILQLKENYIEKESKYKELNTLTTDLIYSKYPKEKFTGQVQYIYRTSGQMQSTINYIGTPIISKTEK